MEQQKNKPLQAERITNGQLGVSTAEPPSSGSGRPAAHLDFHVFVALLSMKIEVYDLWTQACLHLRVHLVAGFDKGFSQFHVVGGQAVVSAQRQSARQKANQVILQGETTQVRARWGGRVSFGLPDTHILYRLK